MREIQKRWSWYSKWKESIEDLINHILLDYYVNSIFFDYSIVCFDVWIDKMITFVITHLKAGPFFVCLPFLVFFYQSLKNFNTFKIFYVTYVLSLIFKFQKMISKTDIASWNGKNWFCTFLMKFVNNKKKMIWNMVIIWNTCHLITALIHN